MAALGMWVYELSKIVGHYAGNAGVDPEDRTRNWIAQFPASSQEPLARALTRTLERTYIRDQEVEEYFTSSVSNADFWRDTHVCRGAQYGKSHEVMTSIVTDAIKSKLGQGVLDESRSGWRTARNHIFIDDAIFSGSRAIEDYGQWWSNSLPQANRRTPSDGPLNIYFWTYIRHTAGEEAVRRWIDSTLTPRGIPFTLTFHSAKTYEDRDAQRNASDVLWPSVMTEKAGSSRLFLATRHDFLRTSGGGSSTVFPLESDRKILEAELLDASIDISARLEKPWTPLGYGRKPFGFGSLSISQRNCPNNAPIALWWNTDYWSPLFPRVTYADRDAEKFRGQDDEVPF